MNIEHRFRPATGKKLKIADGLYSMNESDFYRSLKTTLFVHPAPSGKNKATLNADELEEFEVPQRIVFDHRQGAYCLMTGEIVIKAKCACCCKKFSTSEDRPLCGWMINSGRKLCDGPSCLYYCGRCITEHICYAKKSEYSPRVLGFEFCGMDERFVEDMWNEMGLASVTVYQSVHK